MKKLAKIIAKHVKSITQVEPVVALTHTDYGFAALLRFPSVCDIDGLVEVMRSYAQEDHAVDYYDFRYLLGGNADWATNLISRHPIVIKLRVEHTSQTHVEDFTPSNFELMSTEREDELHLNGWALEGGEVWRTVIQRGHEFGLVQQGSTFSILEVIDGVTKTIHESDDEVAINHWIREPAESVDALKCSSKEAAVCIFRRLSSPEKIYAGDIARGVSRGFAALHDIMDANMLLMHGRTTEQHNADMDEVSLMIIDEFNSNIQRDELIRQIKSLQSVREGCDWLEGYAKEYGVECLSADEMLHEADGDAFHEAVLNAYVDEWDRIVDRDDSDAFYVINQHGCYFRVCDSINVDIKDLEECVIMNCRDTFQAFVRGYNGITEDEYCLMEIRMTGGAIKHYDSRGIAGPDPISNLEVFITNYEV